MGQGEAFGRMTTLFVHSSFVKFVVVMLRSSRSILFLGGVASYVTNHFSRSHRIKALLITLYYTTEERERGGGGGKREIVP